MYILYAIDFLYLTNSMNKQMMAKDIKIPISHNIKDKRLSFCERSVGQVTRDRTSSGWWTGR